jgi:hypothetical protein
MLKRVLLLVAIVICFSIALIVYSRPERRINEANLVKVEEGMTREQVIQILGTPGDYSIPRECVIRIPRLSGKQEGWVTDDIGIYVSFDDNGRVLDKASVHFIGPPLSFFDRIRRWLGLGP